MYTGSGARRSASGDPGRGVRKSRRMCSRGPAGRRLGRRGERVPILPCRTPPDPGLFHEAHLPAKEAQARPHARIPCAYEHAGGQARPSPPSQQGPGSPHPVAVADVPGEDSDPARPARPARRKRRRLSRSGEFERVYREGRSHAGRHLILYAFPRGAGDEGPRLGISVGRRVGGAVERNRVKRALRESFWEQAEPAARDARLRGRGPSRGGQAGRGGGRAGAARGAPRAAARGRAEPGTRP